MKSDEHALQFTSDLDRYMLVDVLKSKNIPYKIEGSCIVLAREDVKRLYHLVVDNMFKCSERR